MFFIIYVFFSAKSLNTSKSIKFLVEVLYNLRLQENVNNSLNLRRDNQRAPKIFFSFDLSYVFRMSHVHLDPLIRAFSFFVGVLKE